MTIRHCERLRSLALGILLAIGTGVAWGVVFGFSLVIVEGVFFPATDTEDVAIMRDGTPLIASYTNAGATYHTLDGKPMNVEYFQFAQQGGLRTQEYLQKPFVGLSWQNRISVLHYGLHDKPTWYFVHDGKLHGHGYGVGYDLRANRIIGYIGRSGFRSDEPMADDQFPVDARKVPYGFFFSAFRDQWQWTAEAWWESQSSFDAVYLLADDGLWEINPKERTVKMLRKDADAVSASFSWKPRPASKPSAIASKLQPTIVSKLQPTIVLKLQPTIVVRTPDRVLVLDLDGKEIEVCGIPAELRDVRISWYQLPENKNLAVGNPFDNQTARLLFWIDARGKIVRQKQVELRAPKSDLRQRVENNALLSLILPSPATDALIFAIGTWVNSRPGSNDASVALNGALRHFWPALLIIAIASVVLAVLCYRRQRRYGLPWAGVWAMFVLLFGVPAYLGYLAHRHWPARLPCPHCGRLAPRDRPACFACGREFPPPKPKGIEVFA